MSAALPLAIVHVDSLPGDCRAELVPEGPFDADGLPPRPSFYYRVDSWEHAREVYLAPHFGLWEFIDVDAREAPRLRDFPRYVPCAVSILAAHLELLRMDVAAPVRIAANGGYRSPSLAGGDARSPHAWGTAANVYRIGDDYMTDRETVERYAAIVRRLLPAAWCRPFGPAPGQTTDHLHIDLGYIVSVPRERP